MDNKITIKFEDYKDVPDGSITDRETIRQIALFSTASNALEEESSILLRKINPSMSSAGLYPHVQVAYNKEFLSAIPDIVAENLENRRYKEIQDKLDEAAKSLNDTSVSVTVGFTILTKANRIPNTTLTHHLNGALLKKLTIPGVDMFRVVSDSTFRLINANNIFDNEAFIQINGTVENCRLRYMKHDEERMELFQIRSEIGETITKRRTYIDVMKEFSKLPPVVKFEGLTFSPNIFINGENDVRLVYDVVDVSEGSPHRHDWKQYGCWHNPFYGLDKEANGKPCGFLFLIENIFDDASMLTAIEETMIFLNRNKSELLLQF